MSAFTSDPFADGNECQEVAAGIVDASTWWAVCATTNGTVRFDRVGVDGALIGSTPLPPFDGLSASLVDPAGKELYMWGPVGKTLTRVDTASGTVSSVTAKIAATTSDPVADLARALGRWIAPPALAKVLVEPGLVLSPDGTRVYALAVDMGNGETVASQGVFVFDAAIPRSDRPLATDGRSHLDRAQRGWRVAVRGRPAGVQRRRRCDRGSSVDHGLRDRRWPRSSDRRPTRI